MTIKAPFSVFNAGISAVNAVYNVSRGTKNVATKVAKTTIDATKCAGRCVGAVGGGIKNGVTKSAEIISAFGHGISYAVKHNHKFGNAAYTVTVEPVQPTENKGENE